MSQNFQTIERVVNLLNPDSNILLNVSQAEAESRVLSGKAQAVREIDGQFAILARDGKTIRMARSIARPMRYFLAKRAEGPCLIVAERIDEIRQVLLDEGLDDQFHPSYTRMVPAHHIVELQLVGCPDPNPALTRFFDPQPKTQPNSREEIGAAYIGALSNELTKWLQAIPESEPIGVLFSGGIDSGSVFLTLYDAILKLGQSPSRLKAFTLSVDGQSSDGDQAFRFLKSLKLEMFLEVFDVASENLHWQRAISAVEDYKPLDIQAATMGLTLCESIRRRYPDWKWLVDGDGGDENLKDYPIEDNPELTIRSVLNNQMLYQEGWGVDAIKHSLVFSGGQSRGHVRSSAPPALCGFSGFSPYALPNVIEIAEGIPFIELTDWDHEKLYRLKGEIVGEGVKAVTGLEMPIYEKCRFQHGAIEKEKFSKLFPTDETEYRKEFDRQFTLTT